LMSQLSIPGSAYRIPVATASQQIWQDWFDKLSEINVHYDIADETIVHTCTGHLPNTDRIMYGWADTVSTIRISGKTVQLSDFFSHIRKQLFVRRDTRHSALLELRLLRQDIATMPDCNALSTRLKQIWLRLFPTTTEELEPIRRHEACLFVHELLIYVKDLGFKQRKTVLHKAWHEFDFRSNDLFMAHLRDSSHETPAKSEIATAAYLTAVCDTLQASQEMYNRIHAAEPTLADHSAKGSVLTLAAEQLGISKQLLINRSGASSGVNGAKRKRPSAPPHPSKQAKARQPLSSDQKEELELRRPIAERLDALCSTVGRPRSLSECIGLFRRRRCVLCEGEAHLKGAIQCPLVTPSQHSQVLKWQQSRRRASKVGLKKGLSAALASTAK
jgi:hypothetical protein